MPAAKPKRVRPQDQLVSFDAEGEGAASRMIDELSRRVALQSPRASSVLEVDLVVGTNRINHNLGRTPSHVTLCPTTADASFAWAVTDKTDTQIVVTVAGVAQTGATLEIK